MSNDRLEDFGIEHHVLSGDVSEVLFVRDAITSEDGKNCKKCNSGGEPEVIGDTSVINCKKKTTYVPGNGHLATDCWSYDDSKEEIQK